MNLETIEERMGEEKVNLLSELRKALRLPGASFTLALLMAFILPALGIFSQEFGRYVAGVFAISGMLAYPLSALASRIMHRKVEVKGDIVLVLLLSLLVSLYSYWPKIIIALVKFLVAVPIAVFTLWTYMRFHDLIREGKTEDWREPFQEILKATLPTIIVVVAISYSLKLFAETFNIQEKIVTTLKQAMGV